MLQVEEPSFLKKDMEHRRKKSTSRELRVKTQKKDLKRGERKVLEGARSLERKEGLTRESLPFTKEMVGGGGDQPSCEKTTRTKIGPQVREL